VPRPCKQRRICCHGGGRLLKPASRPLGGLEVIGLPLDELEAVRLCDLRGLHQHDAAGLMGVSRATLGRILARARGKLARLALEDVALEVGGGNVEADPARYRRGQAHCRRHGHPPTQRRTGGSDPAAAPAK
jgi:predicted DNA-binding protein (UPF0251 family)